MKIRRRHKVLFAFLLLAAILAAVWQWTRMPPKWYRPPDPQQQSVQDSAQGVEMRLMEEAHQIRPAEEDWNQQVGEEEANAWLAARLPGWLANRGREWPEEMGLPQVKFENDAISVAIDAGRHTGGRVIVARVMPEMVEGRLRFQLDGLGIGRIPVPGDPADSLMEIARRLAPGDGGRAAAITDIMDVLTGRETVDPVFELADGRRIRLQDLQTAEGRIDLTSRTLGQGGGGAGQ